jgi:ribonuclease J
MAQKLGYLDFPEDLVVRLDEAVRMRPRDTVIMATGTQGEPSSVLARVSTGQHSQIKILRGDTVIMSSHPVPGNEEMVHRTINRLFQRGAEVLYDPIEQVHVSGHAAQEEQKLMLNLVKPQYFIPVHGELRHLHAHARLARQVGIDAQNIYVVENGYPIEFSDGEARIAERVPGGYVYVDGSGVGDVGPSVLRERELLGRDGFVMAIVHRDPDTGKLLDTPDIVTRGFIYQQEGEEVLAGATQAAMEAVQSNSRASQEATRERVEKVLSEYLYRETKRHPMIMAVVRDL